MSATPLLERLLKRDRTIAIAGLVALCVLAWLYIVSGAGLGMSAWDMTSPALFPHQSAMPGIGSAAMLSWGFSDWALIIAMWWIMMIAMMAPSAAPTILLHASVHRHAVAQGQAQQRPAPTAAFAAGYLLVWLGFSIFATVLHWALERSGLIAAMMMGSQSRWLSAGVLIAAGIYQLSTVKRTCLSHCRAPVSFLSRHWRPHASGALRLGVIHGVHCVGCCWMLMALLFVGGAMNLIWIAALTILVLIERMVPRGEWISRGMGIILVAWGTVTLLV